MRNSLRLFADSDIKRKPLLFISLVVGAVLICLAIKAAGIAGGTFFLIAVIAFPAIYAIIRYPSLGVVTLLIAAYLIMWIIRMGLVNYPLGTVMDGLQALLIVGFFIKQKYKPNWDIYKNPITIVIIIWVSYNLAQFFNPYAESRMAWLYTIRSVGTIQLIYFVFTYQIRTVKLIRLIIKIWLALSMFAALYAFKQEHFGFFEFEQRQLDADPLLQSLLFIFGHWRKFSIFSDPVTFSYNMVASTILCICLIWGPTSNKKKIILAIMAGFFMLNMLYSGTRGAYVLLPAALALFTVMNMTKKVLVFAVISAIFTLFLINVPTGNQNIVRFQSAFKPSDDASFNLREINRARIQPYIHTHAVGGGLGASGVWGVRFAPYSFLAQFPPDSGYLRVAVEMGWIGLIIICVLIFTVLKTGIDNFFKIQNPELKTYCLAMVLIIFALAIGNYPQEALVQYPSNIFFYLEIALINVTLRLDQQKNEISPEDNVKLNYRG